MTVAGTPATAETARLDVQLFDGEDAANVLAKLLKQHIEDIMAADPSKASDALEIRGKLGLQSTEPEAGVTLVFDGAGLSIKNGIDDDVDGVITGTLKLQTETLVGLANPYAAMLRRRLKVRIKPSRPFFTRATYRFLKAPKSMIEAAAGGD
jgi:hypothetical protein